MSNIVTINADMGLRTHIRRELLATGLDFTEDKGWWSTLFFVRCETKAQKLGLQQWLDRMDRAIEATRRSHR